MISKPSSALLALAAEGADEAEVEAAMSEKEGASSHRRCARAIPTTVPSDTPIFPPSPPSKNVTST